MSRIVYLLLLAVVFGVIFTACKKKKNAYPYFMTSNFTTGTFNAEFKATKLAAVDTTCFSSHEVISINAYDSNARSWSYVPNEIALDIDNYSGLGEYKIDSLGNADLYFFLPENGVFMSNNPNSYIQYAATSGFVTITSKTTNSIQGSFTVTDGSLVLSGTFNAPIKH